MGYFDLVMQFIFDVEGGYVNDPNDPGGETKYGISKRANPDVDIKNLTKDQAREIYRVRYWNKIAGDLRPYAEALAIMDFGVHSGVDTALEFWRDAHNVHDYVYDRIDYLRVVRGKDGRLMFPIYGRGWMKRILKLLREIDRASASPDVELLQIFHGPRVIEFEPEKVTVGTTQNKRMKIMVRV